MMLATKLGVPTSSITHSCNVIFPLFSVLLAKSRSSGCIEVSEAIEKFGLDSAMTMFLLIARSLLNEKVL